MSDEPNHAQDLAQDLAKVQKEWHGSLKAYLIGFISSAILTAISFFLVLSKLLSGRALIGTISALAILQALIQSRYFLHVGQEPHPKWETGFFFFMVLVLFIIIVGSIWIMNDLNERVMQGMM